MRIAGILNQLLLLVEHIHTFGDLIGVTKTLKIEKLNMAETKFFQQKQHKPIQKLYII